jgi:hypothetical protein
MIDSTHTTHLSALPATPPGSATTPSGALAPGPGPGTTVSGPGLHPYIAPAIIFRTPLEAVAASCYSAPGKADVLSCLVGNS